MSFFVEEKPARKFDRLNFRTSLITEDEFQVHSRTKEYFANNILSSSVITELCPNNILVFDFVPVRAPPFKCRLNPGRRP